MATRTLLAPIENSNRLLFTDDDAALTCGYDPAMCLAVHVSFPRDSNIVYHLNDLTRRDTVFSSSREDIINALYHTPDDNLVVISTFRVID